MNKKLGKKGKGRILVVDGKRHRVVASYRYSQDARRLAHKQGLKYTRDGWHWVVLKLCRDETSVTPDYFFA